MFSTIGIPLKTKPPTEDDFPALEKEQTREQILLSNLLYKHDIVPDQNSLGSSIMTPGNMDFNSDRTTKIDNKLASLSLRQTKSALESSGSTHRTAKGSTEKYGLHGLIDVIKMTNPDISMLSLGMDLTSLGLNLNDSESIYPNFMTPFSDSPIITSANGGEPVFTLSPSYSSISIPPPLTKMTHFSDETLFYIFYGMPRDVLQEAAAQELFSRSWRFHKEFKLWLTKDDQEDVENGYEKGIYIFFDPASWTRVKKEWVLHFDHLEDRVKRN